MMCKQARTGTCCTVLLVFFNICNCAACPHQSPSMHRPPSCSKQTVKRAWATDASSSVFSLHGQGAAVTAADPSVIPYSSSPCPPSASDICGGQLDGSIVLSLPTVCTTGELLWASLWQKFQTLPSKYCTLLHATTVSYVILSRCHVVLGFFMRWKGERREVR